MSLDGGMVTVSEVRSSYAIAVLNAAGCIFPELLNAFSTVPRELFVGPGPWSIKPPQLGIGYTTTPDADPSRIYQDVLVALDPERGLNNGLPSWHAKLLECGRPKEAESVAHLGCGVGYYTAIISEIVGPRGHVLGVEYDTSLAARAQKNLASRPNCTVVSGDATTVELPEVDFIYVNAGVTEIPIRWLRALKPGGRLIVPMTITGEGGQVLRVERIADTLHAKFVAGVTVFNCFNARNAAAEEALQAAVSTHGWGFDGTIRFDPDAADESCWMKHAHYWFSSKGS